MDNLRQGTSGLRVSAVILGCVSYGEPGRGTHAWTLPEEESRLFIRRALEAGITTFDTADVYSDGSSEEIIGRALTDFATREEGKARYIGASRPRCSIWTMRSPR